MADMQKPGKTAPNAVQNKPTTGHSWDGIEEYNNPLPMWWVWVFIACVIFSIGYVVYYPTFPGGKPTISKWTSVGQLDKAIAEGEAKKGTFEQQLTNTEVHEVEKNTDLKTYAVAAGKTLFALNCSQCHGAGGVGSKGFPSLQDDEWLYGGSLNAITYTITHGIRNTTDPEARNAATMAAYGKDGLLPEDQIKDVVNYLSVLAFKAPENDSSKRGAQVFADNCTACHGEKGEGNREMGAPPLNNAIWLYGGSPEERLETLTNGRAGVMPNWGAKLSANDIKKLALYVHSLGGGEAEPAPAPVAPAVDASATTPAPEAPATAPAAAPEAAPAPEPAPAK